MTGSTCSRGRQMSRRTGTEKWLVAASSRAFFSAVHRPPLIADYRYDVVRACEFPDQSYDFNISSIGTYQATFHRYGRPGTLHIPVLGCFRHRGRGGHLGSISHGGILQFTATPPQVRTLPVLGLRDRSATSRSMGSMYGITVAGRARPEVWAMMSDRRRPDRLSVAAEMRRPAR